MASEERIEEVLTFWFVPPPEEEERPTGRELWFGKGARVEREIRKKFGRLIDRAHAGDLDAWAGTARGRLALILLLDAFTRRMHGEHPEAFAGEEKALALCFDGLDEEMDKQLAPIERCFFYLPAMHAEDADAQVASVEVYQELLAAAPEADQAECAEFLREAQESRDVVERFERFPERNAILGRNSSSDESAFLQQTGKL